MIYIYDCFIESNCTCANSYGRYGLSSSDSDCNFKCSMSKIGEKCGGTLKNSVYKIKSRLDFNKKI